MKKQIWVKYEFVGAFGDNSCGMVMLRPGETAVAAKGTEEESQLSNSILWEKVKEYTQ